MIGSYNLLCEIYVMLSYLNTGLHNNNINILIIIQLIYSCVRVKQENIIPSILCTKSLYTYII